MRRGGVVPGILALLAVIAAVGCSSGGLAVSTTSPIPESECGRAPGAARGTWRAQLNYCE
jgi:hypothetical protein